MGNKDIQKIRRIEARENNIRSFLRKVPRNLRGFNIVENLEQGSDFTIYLQMIKLCSRNI